MPELPEIETLARELRKKISGRVLSRIWTGPLAVLDVPPEILAAKLSGKEIRGVGRRGKYLALEFEGNVTLWLHLGMTGRLVWADDKKPHTHMVLHFKEGEPLVFCDIRRFGKISLGNGRPESVPEPIRRLAADPFEISEDAFITIFKKRTGRIKSLLLNQRIVAGLGNIYADESLHRAGIHPRRRPRRVTREKLRRLHGAICETLREAIESGGSTIDDYVRTDGSRGSFQNFHKVYGRRGAPCRTCGAVIKRVRLAGRSSYFCPSCQR